MLDEVVTDMVGFEVPDDEALLWDDMMMMMDPAEMEAELEREIREDDTVMQRANNASSSSSLSSSSSSLDHASMIATASSTLHMRSSQFGDHDPAAADQVDAFLANNNNGSSSSSNGSSSSRNLFASSAPPAARATSTSTTSSLARPAALASSASLATKRGLGALLDEQSQDDVDTLLLLSDHTLDTVSASQAPSAKRARGAHSDADNSSSNSNSNNNGNDTNNIVVVDDATSATSTTAPTTALAAASPRYVYSRMPTHAASISLTDSSGQRFYVVKRTPQEHLEQINRHVRMLSHARSTHLMSRPIHDMLRVVERQLIDHALQRANEERQRRQYDSDPEDDPAVRARKRKLRAAAELSKARERKRHRRLWVDKYAPRQFVDLISPEHLNRDILMWLKSWDPCVFGRAAPTLRALHAADVAAAAAAAAATAPPADPHDNRPEHRVILLCGPPGLGKTTLATVLARHAGYQTVEVNASDDRSEEVLREKIRNASEMRNVFGDTRPNCIILDEIDGVLDGPSNEKGAIQALVKIVTAPLPRRRAAAAGGTSSDNGNDAASGANDGGGDDGDDDDDDDADADANSTAARRGASSATTSTSGRRRGGAAGAAGAAAAVTAPVVLRRPIICICNDEYAPALRPLKQVARVFHIERPAKKTLVERLSVICAREGLRADPHVLSHLVDMVGYDIRSCLNTLQFVHAKGDELTLDLLRSLAIGQKDVAKSRFDLLDAVFIKQQPTSRAALARASMAAASAAAAAAATAAAGGAASSLTTSATTTTTTPTALSSPSSAVFHTLFAHLGDAGDVARVLDGLHHNYLRVPLSDPDMLVYAAASEWFSYVDRLHGVGQDETLGSSAGFSPIAAFALHMLCSRPRRILLEAPNTFFLYQDHLNRQHVIKSFLSPDNALVLSGMTVQRVVLDVLPHLLYVLAPTVRSNSIHMLTQHDRRLVDDLVDTMLSLKLTFRPDASHVTSYSLTTMYALDPPIDALCTFTLHTSDSTADARGGHKSSRFQPVRLALTRLRDPERDIPAAFKPAVAKEIAFEAVRRAEAKRLRAVGGNAETAAAESAAQAAATTPAPAATTASTTAAATAATAATAPPKRPMTFLEQHSQRLRAKQSAAVSLKFQQKGASSSPFAASAAASSSISSSTNPTAASTTAAAATTTAAAATVAAAHRSIVSFRFHEGFTQAVRRSVTVAHFL